MSQQLYFKGDLAEYTGKSKTLYGGLFYEIKLLEGHLKGEIRHVSKPPLVTKKDKHTD